MITSLNTHYSFLLGYAKPKEFLKQYANYGYKTCAISDYNSLSGSVNFSKNCNSNGINPVIGSRVRICDEDNNPIGYIALYAINKTGWFELVKITSSIYMVDHECVTLESLRDCKNIVALINGTDFIVSEKYLRKAKDIFEDRLYVGIDTRNLSYAQNRLKYDELRAIGDKLNCKIIASPLIAYSDKSDKNDHLTLYSSNLGITSNEWSECYDPMFSQFYNGDYSLPSSITGYSVDEMKNLEEFENLFEKFSILEKPSMPDFICPNNMSQKDYLRFLCREGWKKKFGNKILTAEEKQVYVDRVNYELDVIGRAGLDGYFLIVQDYVNWCKDQKWLIGCSRGSAGGCLVSYLINITSIIDPIKYSLIFERFYNDGRNTADRISFPDIDVDFPVCKRELVVEYIRETYGRDRVTQVMTLQSLQGRGALKEVMRIHNACPPKMMDSITKNLPNKDKISDRLQESKEISIINWTLKYEPERISDYCTMNDDGSLSGQYAQYFEQAIKIERTYKTFGKHASALVISKDPMINSCPMIREKNGNELIAGIEFSEMEDLGKIKQDILGLKNLDVLMNVNDSLKGIN